MTDQLRSIRVKRTSQQWKAFPDFRHCVEFSRQFNYENFWQYYQAQMWCWDQFGPSINLDIWVDLQKSHKNKMDEVWAYQAQTSLYPCRIYFKSDKELEVFLLKWG